MDNTRRKTWRGGGGNKRRAPFWMNSKPPVIHPSVLDGSAARQSDSSFQIFSQSEEKNPFRGWKYYFPDEKFKQGSELAGWVEGAVRLFKTRHSPELQRQVEEERCLGVDFASLVEDDRFMRDWSRFTHDVTESPSLALPALGLALYQVVSQCSDLQIVGSEFPPVYARLVNYEPVMAMKSIRAALYGKLVSVRGTVVRVGSSQLLCTWMGFACNSCGHVQSIPQKEGKYRVAARCKAEGGSCSSKSFTPLCSSRATRTKTRQTIRIQENTDDDQREGGRVPRTLECELTDDLVDSCAPGDNITITAIVKVNNGEEGGKSKGRSNNLFSVYLEAMSIVNSKGETQRSNPAIGLQFSLKDYYAIQEIHNESDQFRLLVNSVCPTVYGHEMVKAGLLLALVGGAAGATLARAEPHVLILGDPGQGKSHLLHAATGIAPRGVYVCGNTASGSGLTVTLIKESGGYALEAGALVLANHGVCCIDEFDKMTHQHQALLEAMEQQRVSVAKGGVVCRLPAKTTVLAAANPVSGHYNPAKSLSDNINISHPLLSRFDLVFLLVDKPDQELDSLLSEHVMALHSGKPKNPRLANSSFLSASGSNKSSDYTDPNLHLSVRLKVKRDECLELVPQALLRKYLAYARKYVTAVTLSQDASRIIQQFYLELRKSPISVPVTTRQLESVIRLTQARAKIELREEATAEDAIDVVQLIQWSLSNSNTVPENRSTTGGRGSKVKRFIAALERKSQVDGRDGTFKTSELREVHSSLGLPSVNFLDFLGSLNTHGYFIKKGPDLYKLLSP